MQNKHAGKTNYKIKDSADKTDTVQEPIVVYGNPMDASVAKTIVIMGMENKREFSHVRNDNDFINLIRTGLPKQAMTHLMQVADLTLAEMANIVHTSDRTLRRYSTNQKLSQEQSERMIEIAKLYSRGEKVFDTLERFREWMDTALFPLGNKKPKEFLDTSLGINMLMDELGRIEHGIFA